MNNPLVSVLVPVYNVEKYLERCLDSILNQTLTQIEIVCVNDGSTDGSLKILEEYRKKDSRIIIVNKENGGLPSARNAGLDNAKGKYVGFVDSDDYIEPKMFEKLYRTAEKDNSEVVICGANIFPENPHASDWLYACLSPVYKKIEGFDANFLFYDQSATPFLWRVLIKRELIEKNHLRLQENIMIGEDKAFQCKVYPLANRISVIPDKLYNYFWYREGSLMNQTVYGNPEKKVIEHGRLIQHIADVMKGYEINQNEQFAFLDWSVPFVYDDFIFLSLEKKVDLAKELVNTWVNSGYYACKHKLPEWKREMFEYFEQVSKEQVIKPYISIVVPVDIDAEYLQTMMEKTLSQSLKEIEVIFVNNGTKNEYYTFLHKYLFKDKRVRLLNMPHSSYADAMNKGINLACGKYVTFLETSNWYKDKYSLENWFVYAEANSCDICGSVFCKKDLPESKKADYTYVEDDVEEIGKFLDNDFQNMLYKTSYLKENNFSFTDSTIMTGLKFLVDTCFSTDKLCWYNQVVNVHRIMHKKDWISTDKCKQVLIILESMMEVAVQQKCAYLQAKIIEMINGDYLKKIIINNTRAFRAPSSEFPNGENSQVEVIECLMHISSFVDYNLLYENGYSTDRIHIDTLYEIIKERHKFLADLTN